MIRQFGSKIVLFVMLSSLLGSCSKEPNKEEGVGQRILVDPFGIFSETYPLLYKSFIALETNDSSLIQAVNKVHLTDSLIFILDQMQSQVLIFNADGRFRNKISRRGQGPEEYVDICDMYIDVLLRQLYVYDGRMGELLCYNFDGKFIDRHRLCHGYGVAKDNGGHWIVNRGTSRRTGDEEDANNRLFIYSSGFQYDSEGVVFNPYLRGRRYSFTYDNCEFSKFQDTVSFLPVMENVAYKIVDGEVRPWYDIQFKGHEQEVLRHGMDKEATRQMLSDIRKARVPGRISKFQRIDNHLLFTFNYEKLSEMSILCCYDLQTGKNVMTKAFGDDHGLLVEPITYVYHDSVGNTDGHKDNLVLGLLGHTAFMASKRNHSNEIIDKMNAAIGDGAECNPILVFYTIRDMK